METEEKLQLTRKAYRIDINKLSMDFFFSDEMICYAENRNKAKKIFLDRYKYDFLKLGDGTDITYLNMPVKRYHTNDLYWFEGEELTIRRIKEVKAERERLQKLQDILKDDSITYCYIKKGMYYRPNCRGYTDYIEQAGIYLKHDAVSKAKGVSEIRLIPINVEEHNAKIQAKIDDLKTRIIGHQN